MAVSISNLNEVLSSYLNDHETIINYEIERLTAHGENYGSEMLSLTIKIQRLDKIETIKAVAKVPPQSDFFRRMFNTPVTFKYEILFYQTIIPEIENFLQEKNHQGLYANCFPKLLGARFNPEDIDNAVLVLENLKVDNFQMGLRTKGFDLSTTKTILKTMAQFHAVPLAFKLLRPEVFAIKIRPHFKMYKTFEIENGDELMLEKVKVLIDGIDSIKQYSTRVLEAFKKCKIVYNKCSEEYYREPLTTIIHTDSWVNNFMINSDVNRCKIVDFQLLEYGSPMRDFIFFLFTSVENDVLRDKYDELIQYYHESFLRVLDDLGCKTDSFPIGLFEREIEIVIKQLEFAHIMYMLTPIFANKEELKDLTEFNEKDLTTVTEVPDGHKKKAELIVQEFVKKNWI